MPKQKMVVTPFFPQHCCCCFNVMMVFVVISYERTSGLVASVLFFCLLCVRQTPSHKTRTNGLSFSQLYEGNIVLLSWCRVGCGILFQLCRLLCLPHLLIRTCILYFYHLIPLGCFGRYWNSWFFHLKRSG